MRIRLLIFIVLGITPGLILGEAWSLDSCISYAMIHDISLRQQQLQTRGAEQDVVEARDRYLPTLDASVSENISFGRGLTVENTYADRNTTSTGWNVGLSLPLFQGTAAWRRERVARLSLQRYLLETEALRDNVALNVMAQYLQVVYSREVERAAESQAALSAFEVERQREMVEAGKVAEATLYDLEAVAARDRLQVVSAANDTQVALVNLANLLRLPSVEGFDVETPSGEEPYIGEGPDAVYAEAMRINRSLAGARQGIRVAEENVALARTGYIPTLSFNAGLGSSYYTVGGLHNESFGRQMRNNFATYLGFSLRVPIFDAFSTRNSVRRARLQQLEAELTVEQRESDLYKDIQLAWYQAKGAQDRWQTSEQTLEKTRLSYEATVERFNLGRATQADYEQARNNLFTTDITRLQARYEYLLRARILRFYQTNSWR